MAIAPVGGAVTSSAVGVTTLTLTYSPATGNTIVIGVLLKTSSGSVIVLQDNLGNTYANDAVQSSSAVFHISSVPAGVTGFTASGFTSQTLVMAVEEYSGAAGAQFLSTVGANSISGTIPVANDYIVGLDIAGSALTITAGNQRQVTGAVNGDNIVIADITSATPGSLTLSQTGATGFNFWFAYLVGGPGAARQSQDVILVAGQVTGAKARVDQDIILSANKVTSAKARVDQDLILVAEQSTSGKARFGQDVILVAGRSTRTALLAQDVILVAIQNTFIVNSFVPHFISPIHQRRRIRTRRIQRGYLLQAKKKFPFLFIAT